MAVKINFSDLTDFASVISNGKALLSAIQSADTNKPLDSAINASVSFLSIAATSATLRAKSNPALIPQAETINSLSASASAAAAIHNFHNGDIKNGISNTAAAIASSASIASLAAEKAGGKAGGRAAILADAVAVGGNTVSIIAAHANGSSIGKFLMENAKHQLYSQLKDEGFTDEEIEAFGVSIDDSVKSTPPQENILIDSNDLSPNTKSDDASSLIKHEVVIVGQDGKIREQTIYSRDNNISEGGKVKKQDVVIIGKDGIVREETIHILAPKGETADDSGGTNGNNATNGSNATGSNGNTGSDNGSTNPDNPNGSSGSASGNNSGSGSSGWGATLGGAIGAAVGGALGGPLGAMVGQIGGTWAGSGKAPPWLPPFPSDRLDPLALDLDGDGKISTMHLARGVHFDLDNSGFAEKTAWVAGNDALLARDINGNGIIDGGFELLGDGTRLKDGSTAKNGFAALADLDDNGDGQVNAQDDAWKDLLIWQDVNQDGISQSGELTAITEAHIAALLTTFAQGAKWDGHGVNHSERGHFVKAEGSQGVLHSLQFFTNKADSVAVDIQHGRM